MCTLRGAYIKSSLYSRYYAEACYSGAHHHCLAPGQHSSEETSQWWRAVVTLRPI